MKNKLNVIQINGIKGIIFLICAVVCLAAGFIIFPGLVLKSGWNLLSSATGMIPAIGIIQGTLLWGILIVSYFAFGGKKNLFVEFKSADDLSGAELDAVMRKIKAERQADLITKSIMRARELEVNSKAREEMINSWKALENTIKEETEKHAENISDEDSSLKH